MISLPYKLLAIVLLLVGLWAAYEGWAHHEQGIGRAEVRAELQPKIDTLVGNIAAQKAEAAALLKAETAKVAALQTQLNTAHAAQEKQDAQNKQVIANQGARLRALADSAGRLRDPNAAGCGRGSGGTESQPSAVASSGAANDAGSTGLLSVQLSELLQARLLRADEINIAFASCRADSINVRAQ